MVPTIPYPNILASSAYPQIQDRYQFEPWAWSYLFNLAHNPASSASDQALGRSLWHLQDRYKVRLGQRIHGIILIVLVSLFPAVAVIVTLPREAVGDTVKVVVVLRA
jgi:hypothetical protein